MLKKEKKSELTFLFCDYSNNYHCERLGELINSYISDPMGGGKQLSGEEKLLLISTMQNHPSGFVMFAVTELKIVGLATCFVLFSTFRVRHYLYIHDVIVQKEFRRSGIGKKLVERCIGFAKEQNYCKVTLEVREDNLMAKSLYKDLGFNDSEPQMLFWTKML
jgi:ribosomal protein S18 acetylase RimI-like enzyme